MKASILLMINVVEFQILSVVINRLSENTDLSKVKLFILMKKWQSLPISSGFLK
jgi:hypothetical protein